MSHKQSILIVLFLIAMGITCRLLPHPWNTTPITAIVLFSSAYFGFHYSLISFLGIMFITDAFIGFYQWQIMLSVYGSIILAGIIGLSMKKKQTVGLILLSTLGSSLIFFIITNWAVWQFGTMYPHSISGLFQSYLMAIPFFKNSLAGDILYSGLLFGAYKLSVLYYFKFNHLMSRVIPDVN